MVRTAQPLLAVCVAVALAALPVRGESAWRTDAAAIAKLQGDMAYVLDAASESDLIPVTIVMRDQVPRHAIEQAVRTRDPKDRRATVVRLLRSLADRSQADVLAVLRAEQRTGAVGRRIQAMWIANMVAAEVTPGLAYHIAARGDVARLVHNSKLEILDDPAVEQGSIPNGGIECGVELMQTPRVWNELGITGKGALVAVADTGTCHTHPDLIDHIWHNPGEIPDNGIDDDNNGYIDDIIGWNFEEKNNDPRDTTGHGTHTAGTVVGDGTEGTVTGMAPGAALMVLRVGSQAGFRPSDVWEAMQYAVTMNAHVINMSFGWMHSMNPPRATWREVSENTMAAGSGLVVGAGGGGNCCRPYDAVTTPGDVPDVITVGASDCNDIIASFSSRGPVTWQDVPPYNDWPWPPGKLKPTVCAPGVNTISCRAIPCNGYTIMSGTSMATPHVTGAVALMIEADPNISPERMKDILKRTSVDLGDPGPDNAHGAGRVDAYEAVLAAGGINCDLIKKFKVKCKGGKLKVVIKSGLEKGVRLTVVDNGEQTVIRTNRKGKANLKKKNQTGIHDVSIKECPECSAQVDCG